MKADGFWVLMAVVWTFIATVFIFIPVAKHNPDLHTQQKIVCEYIGDSWSHNLCFNSTHSLVNLDRVKNLPENH